MKVEPKELLKEMVSDLKSGKSIQAAHKNAWGDVRQHGETMAQEERFDCIVSVLEQGKPTFALRGMANAGLLEFCMPLCLPLKSRGAMRDLMEIIEYMDRCEEDVMLRTAVLLYPFDAVRAKETLVQANIAPQGIDLIINALKNMDDYMLIKSPEALKRFIYRNGRDGYEFTVSLAKAVSKALDLPEYKRLSKDYLLEIMEGQKHPIFPEDLDITKEDLIEEGVADREDVQQMLILLTEYCHKDPLANSRERLLAQAKAFRANPLKKFFRNIKWIH